MNPRTLAAASTLTLLVIACCVGALSIGPQMYSPWVALQALWHGGEPGPQFIVGTLRLPRVVACVVAGASLGMAGYVTQKVLRNPLASPDIIGITSGASCAAVLYVLAGSATGFSLASETFSLGFVASVGALLAGTIVLAAAYRRGLSAVRVILLGLGVNAGFSALTSYALMSAALPDVNTALIWLTGSVNSVTWPVIGSAAGILVAAGTAVAAGTRTQRVLELGTDVSSALGLRPHLATFGLLGGAMLLAAAGTAVAGPVGFVAFVAPHIATFFMRGRSHVLFAGLVGALIMVVADVIARAALPTQVPVGIVTSVAGAPVLLLLLLRLRSRA